MRNFLSEFILFLVKTLFECISSRNIIYIKLIQWTFKERDYLPKSVNEYLNSFRDSAPFKNSDINWEVFDWVKDVASRNSEEIIINETPINSGTISIVFEGKINGQDVIFKTKRKNIEEKFENVEAFLRRISNICKFFSGYNFESLIEKLNHSLKSQCDFKDEADKINLFHGKAKKYKKLNTIQCLKQYSNSDLLTMTRAEGVNPETLSNDELVNFQKIYFASILFLFFSKGIVHSDIHYGNMLYHEGKLTFIDLGMVLSINPEQTSDFQDIAFAAFGPVLEFPQVLKSKIHCFTDNKEHQKIIIEYINDYVLEDHGSFGENVSEIGKLLGSITSLTIPFKEELSISVILILSVVRLNSEIKDDSIFATEFEKVKSFI